MLNPPLSDSQNQTLFDSIMRGGETLVYTKQYFRYSHLWEGRGDKYTQSNTLGILIFGKGGETSIHKAIL